uniref:Motility protein n=1 Tax=Rhodopseudomonas palustris (strain BisA53) TaxID=316055 RepID=Q07H20_RHOP5
MDMSLISAALGAQAGNIQMQVAASIMKSNANSEKFAVATLLGAAQENLSTLANVASGIGGNLDISA